MKDTLLVLAGAVIGACVGHLGVGWLWGQGYYAMILPGGLCGLGAGVFRTRSRIAPFICGILAIVATLYAEWRYFPFVTDGSLRFFLSHLTSLQTMTIIDLVVGAVIGFYVPFRRGQDAKRAPAASS
jgi:hypothetical protein